MNILFMSDIDPNKFGSFEEFTLFLGRELHSRGHSLFLAFTAEPDADLRRQLEKTGSRLLVFPWSSKGITLQGALRMYTTIRELDIDIVHLNFYSLTNPLLLGVYLSDARIIYTDHSSGDLQERPPLKYCLARLVHFLLGQRISKYVAVSDYVKQRLSKTHHVEGKKTITIFNSVNTERFSPRSARDSRRALDLPSDKKIICCVAHLIPEKGLQYLVRALALLIEHFNLDDVFLAVAGDGPQRCEIEELVKTLHLDDKVTFLGRRSDIHLVISAADVVVVPSVWAEAFGIIIAEAMASSRAVIASSVGGIPEIIEPEKNGLLVRPADVSSLAQALSTILTDDRLRQQMGEEGRLKAVWAFNLEKQTEAFADLYDSILPAAVPLSRPVKASRASEALSS